MKNRINALGQYIVKTTGKPFNFKLIKSCNIYKGVLFSVGNDDYLVTDDKAELLGTMELIAMRTSEDYPVKVAKKYTHAKFSKLNKKKEEIFLLNGVKYHIIKL